VSKILQIYQGINGTYSPIAVPSGPHIHGSRFLRLSFRFAAIRLEPPIIASTSDLHSLLEQFGLNVLELKDARVEFTLPLDLNPEPKQHQLFYAKSPFHLVDCLQFDHFCGVCNPLRTAFCFFSPNQMMRGFPRRFASIVRVLEYFNFLDLLKRVGKMCWKRSFPTNRFDPELLHALLVLLHALPCAIFFGHDIMWRSTRGYVYFRRWGSVKMGV
jgi:hypothetical protein